MTLKVKCHIKQALVDRKRRTNDRSRSYGVHTEMNEEYEKIEFKTWQDLAKFVIDGGEVYGKYRDGSYRPILFNGIEFTEHVEVFFKYCYTKIK